MNGERTNTFLSSCLLSNFGIKIASCILMKHLFCLLHPFQRCLCLHIENIVCCLLKWFPHLLSPIPIGNCVFAVAVARRGTLDIQRLKGTRSCHNGAKWTSGWNLPLGFLLTGNDLIWDEGQPLSHGKRTVINQTHSGSRYP